MAQDLENQIVNLDEGYEKLTVEISKQGEEWHREIDVVITKMKKKISEIKVKHKDILHKHLNEIKQIQSLILQDLKATQEIEESNEASIVIEYNSENREFSKSPTEFKVSLPTFIPKPIDREKLYSLFGKITLLSTAIEQNVLLPKMPPNTSATKLLDEPKLDVKIQILQSMLSNVSYVDDEKIWISGETGEIKCFNIKGLLLYTVWTKSGEFPTDIAVDGNGDLLFSDWRTKSVYTSKNWQTEELIRLEEWTPCQLCVTSTGDILVTMYSDDISQSKVVRYSGSTEKQTIQFDEEGKPLFSGNSINKYIRENRNHDICVADYGASAVVVVNQDGELRWRYTGHSPTSKNKNFYPCGITTDSQSRILTADGENHCIHILDQDGEFLRYIDNCDLNDPWGLSVDNSDNLFVCEYESGNLKKIKYLK
uniref:Tripartite motif-containing protein 3 n=1 Tax=Magallana gigas TaxID=29159 RepID=K1QW42_MAGGI